MKPITFFSHPITWTWNVVTNALTGQNDTIYQDVNEDQPLSASGPGARITCIISQVFMFLVIVYLVYKLIKSRF